MAPDRADTGSRPVLHHTLPQPHLDAVHRLRGVVAGMEVVDDPAVDVIRRVRIGDGQTMTEGGQ